jgi:HD superfamily phosphohydrolase
MREQAYRDPVHGFITVTDDLLLRLIDTPELQRLRRIRQLGASYGTYHGAEQSRFGHSLGCTWVMQRILERLVHSGHPLPGEVRLTALGAALLHDVGHGPFSHALEGQLTPGVGHEDWSRRILLEDTQVHRALAAADQALPARVASVLAGDYQGPRFVMELVSSQLDVDRMDYLLRDSLYTGVTYGRFDLHRVINTLQLVDERVVVQAKGVVAIEEYVLARYFMYWQVYLHKATRSQELLLRGAWRRALGQWEQGDLLPEEVAPGLLPFLRGREAGLGAFLALDDYDIVASLKAWRHHSDPILADLATRFLDRKLLKPVFKVPHTGDVSAGLEATRQLVSRRGWDPEYYVLTDHTKDSAYDTYSEDGECGGPEVPILGLDERGRPTEISRLSETIRAIAARPRQAVNVYVPQEVVEETRKLFSQ